MDIKPDISKYLGHAFKTLPREKSVTLNAYFRK